MPEETEFKTLVEEFEENLKEQRQERKEESGFLKMASLSTAIIAVIAALATLESGSTVNEALSKKNDVAVAISKASDQWAFYQAKGIKVTVLESQKSVLTTLGKSVPVSASQDIDRYKKEQDDIKQIAKKYELEAEQLTKEADHLLEQHHGYAFSVAILQISVALSAIAALTKNRPVWIMSLVVASAGTFLAVNSFMMKTTEPTHNGGQALYKRGYETLHVQEIQSKGHSGGVG
jgi:uncharacterized membrane protein YjjP (DUF1212 family)